MVTRTETTPLEECEGIVESVAIEDGINRPQYHITIDATNVEIGGATGKLHEWIPMSPKATEESIPQGSVMDRFLTQIEICISAAKKASTVNEAMNMMVGKKFKFKKLKLGKDFEGHAAKDYWVPVALL